MNAFNDTTTINWKQSNNIRKGDIYIAEPYSAIMFKCEVIETGIPYKYKKSNVPIKQIMKIKLIKKNNQGEWSFKKLKEYGIKAIRSPISLTDKLSKELNNCKKNI